MESVIQYENIIAIDPDVDKSGVAWLHKKEKLVECTALLFPELMDYLLFVKNKSAESGESYRVLIEAAWLNSSNWHLSKGVSTAKAAKMGENVGRNIETGRKIAEMCVHHNVIYELRKPLLKCWRGKNRKITTDELNMQLRQYGYAPLVGRINQEMRDATLLALMG